MTVQEIEFLQKKYKIDLGKYDETKEEVRNQSKIIGNLKEIIVTHKRDTQQAEMKAQVLLNDNENFKKQAELFKSNIEALTIDNEMLKTTEG